MVATPTSIYHDEESLPIQGICARYRGRPARARWGQNNRSVAQPAKYFRGGARVIRGPFQENIGRFVAARQLPDHPIAISVWCKYRLRSSLHNSLPLLPVLTSSFLIIFFRPSLSSIYLTLLCPTRPRTCTHTVSSYTSTLSRVEGLCILALVFQSCRQ